MPSDLQVSNIKDLTGSNTGLSIASDGQVTITQNNPTITLGANATFPTKVTDKTYLYRSEGSNLHNLSFGDYITSPNLNAYSSRHSISVPEGFTSIQSMYYVWLAGSASSGGFTIRLQAVSNKNGEAYNGTVLSATNLLSSASRTADQVNKENVLSVSAINTFMTTHVEGGDLLGIRCWHDTAVNQYAIGFMITWRF